MTSIQVEYWKNEEARRHNLNIERLTGEQQAELARHNYQQEQIGYAQASASALQAQAAMKQADIQYRLSQLQELRTQSDISLNMYHMNLMRSQAEYNAANTGYVKARTYQQELESGVYGMFGSQLAAADLSYRTQQYYESSARTENLRSLSETEKYKRAQLAGDAIKSGISALDTLFGSNKDKSLFKRFFNK